MHVLFFVTSQFSIEDMFQDETWEDKDGVKHIKKSNKEFRDAIARRFQQFNIKQRGDVINIDVPKIKLTENQIRESVFELDKHLEEHDDEDSDEMNDLF